ELFITSFVDAWRLARGPDKGAGKKIGEARVMLPVGDQAAQQVGPSQQGTVGRLCASDRNMISSAGAGMSAVEHELLCSEPREKSFFIQSIRLLHEVFPVRRRMNIYFDHAGIGRDDEPLPAVIAPRVIP